MKIANVLINIGIVLSATAFAHAATLFLHWRDRLRGVNGTTGDPPGPDAEFATLSPGYASA